MDEPAAGDKIKTFNPKLFPAANINWSLFKLNDIRRA
jgi:hypothetical protein